MTVGIFVTGTDTGIGKTVVAGAIADWFRRQEGVRVAVCKPCGSGAVHRREGLVSEDAVPGSHGHKGRSLGENPVGA